MRSTKSYGVVSCWQEHKMLVKAEHTFERNQKQKGKSLKPVFNENNKRRCGEMT